ncbi:hypothetical protein NliqN6_6577 [Naganishia liquefaciens]|uniref:Transcriptional coactivator p15 (PC4) C-terminal domain-containing protein n=1 Tax=Naganishia liquefaciens TaxID=104408 RepID=A0A8H3YHM8_9TREE|nr:hypothetical protein NliqN6_6577 [Naganishia liquefaciens]
MPGIKSESTVKDETGELDQGDVVKQEEPKHESRADEGIKVEASVKPEEETPREPTDEEESREEPRSKKRKVADRADMDEDAVEAFVNENGENYIELSNKRRATVREFKGSTLIDLREYYTDKSGEEKPGAKGLSLTAEQWVKLKNAIPQIDAWVAAAESRTSKKPESGASKNGRGKGRGRVRS